MLQETQQADTQKANLHLNEKIAQIEQLQLKIEKLQTQIRNRGDF